MVGQVPATSSSHNASGKTRVNDLAKLVARLEAAEAEQLAAAERAKAERESAHAELRQRLADGRSSGDPLDDYLLFMFGHVDPAAREKLGRFNDQLKNAKNLLIAVSHGAGNSYQSFSLNLAALPAYSLGRLTGWALHFDFRPNITTVWLPTRRYIHFSGSWNTDNWDPSEVWSCNERAGRIPLPELNRLLGLTPAVRGGAPCPISLIIGFDNFTAELRRQNVMPYTARHPLTKLGF